MKCGVSEKARTCTFISRRRTTRSASWSTPTAWKTTSSSSSRFTSKRNWCRVALRHRPRSSLVAGFNKVILIGNLTRNPELRYTPSGTPVASFGLAVSRRFKQGEDLKEEVCFVDIVVFGRQAEHCGQYLSKGNGAIVEGRLQQRRWETEDGQKRSKHEVGAQTGTFMPKRQDGGTRAEPPMHDEPGYDIGEEG